MLGKKVVSRFALLLAPLVGSWNVIHLQKSFFDGIREPISVVSTASGSSGPSSPEALPRYRQEQLQEQLGYAPVAVWSEADALLPQTPDRDIKNAISLSPREKSLKNGEIIFLEPVDRRPIAPEEIPKALSPLIENRSGQKGLL